MLVGGPLYISTGIQSANSPGLVSNKKCTQWTCSTTQQQWQDWSRKWRQRNPWMPKAPTFEDCRRCSVYDNNIVTVITMQMQPGNEDWLKSGAIRVESKSVELFVVQHCGFWMREKRRSHDLVRSLNGSEREYTQSFRRVLNLNCRST